MIDDAARAGGRLGHASPFLDDVARGGSHAVPSPGSLLDDVARSTRSRSMPFGRSLGSGLQTSAHEGHTLTTAVDDVVQRSASLDASANGTLTERGVEEALRQRLTNQPGVVFDPVTGKAWTVGAGRFPCVVDVKALTKTIVAAGAGAKLSYEFVLVLHENADGTKTVQYEMRAAAPRPEGPKTK